MLERRKYVHKGIAKYEKHFDPLRIKLRVMPISRMPFIRSKDADFYFVEAYKKAQIGDFTMAIELLKKGLEIKPNHLLCKFNLAVLKFKLGLIQEALIDF